MLADKLGIHLEQRRIWSTCRPTLARRVRRHRFITGNVYDPNTTPPTATFLGQTPQTWQEMQASLTARLLQLSTRNTWIKSTRSEHYVHTQQPDLVIQAIRSLLPTH